MSRTFTVIQIAFLLIIWTLIGLGAHMIYMHYVEKSHELDLKTLADKLTKECQDEKELTNVVEQNYQDELDSLGRQLIDAKRMQPSYCVTITSSKTSVNHEGPTEEEFLHKNERGLDRDWLLNFSAEAEQVRLQLIGCQKFINDTWKLKGQ